MLALIIVALTCIPREDPPEKENYLEHLGSLPEILNENSGMVETGNLIWFINDSGNDSVLYGFDKDQSSVVRTVAVKNATNNDWEDITQNDDFLFIGDFGNNASGNRTDLRIYIIDKTELMADVDTIAAAGVIEFHYEDQTNFEPVGENTTAFDCEAFIATEDSIVLFAKDWQNAQTRLYTLPASPGNYEARLRKQWSVNGLITAAAWSQNRQQLFLLGYTAVPFLWIYSGFNPEELTFTESIRTDFGDYFATQTEGLLITDDGSILISSEYYSQNNPAELFEVVIAD